MGYRLVNLQVLNNEMWRALAQGQQTFFASHQGSRGEIYFQDGSTPAAINEQATFCFASPREIDNEGKTVDLIGEALDLDRNRLTDKIGQEGSFVPLKHNLTESEVERIKEIDFPGIYLDREQTRVYPQQKLASQVIGFLGGNDKGQYGLESYYNKKLSGKEGFLKREQGSGGNLIFTEQSTVQPGSDLRMTLNYNIQYFAEKLLRRAAEKWDIRGGSIIVLDPETGQVFALANYPSFDPNEYSKQKVELFKNNAVQSVFEPGSVFKPVTLSGGLNENDITPGTTYVDKGKVKVGGEVIRNYEGRTWGKRTMTEVLEKSINTGAVFAQQQLGNEDFIRYLEKFGIFEKTGVDLAGEISSQNEEFKQGWEANYATAAFGQGIEMTPMQLTRAFAALINGGRLITPHLAEEVGGKLISPPQGRRVISSETSSQITTMLVSVVENGFGGKAQLPGYYVGGKTGTAQVPKSALGENKSGYSDQTWQSFIGFAPAFNPEFLALVKLDNPTTKSASESAAVLFHDLAEYIVNYWEIPSTKK